jgi:hypothetical protein
MKSKDQIDLENLYLNIIKEDVNDQISSNREQIAFEDPFGRPFFYNVVYDKNIENISCQNSFLEINILSANAFPLYSDQIAFPITKDSEPNLENIHDWIYNYEINGKGSPIL